MARTISDEQIKLSVIIDGNPAQKELHDVEKSIRDLNKQQTELRKEKQLLEKAGQKESARYREVTQAMRENTAAITANKSHMEQLQREIGLTGLTMGQLRSKATALRATLNNLIPGSEDYRRFDAELNRVNARISELRGNAQAAGFSLGNIADGFNRYAALGATVVASLTGVVLSVQKIIDLNGKLSDAQSNVMKTTGMTKEEVDQLTKSFGLLETRTSRINLLGIAETGGRLGIPKEEIESFVKVMDKASVALGDSFEGGPEVVAEKLGRIKGLFTELKDSNVEFAFNSVGSAMNDLGASGAASEQNIAEFVTRIGAMPEALKPSIGEALGLGAAFEESGLKAEVAATNYSKIISIAARDTSAFAQVMGRSTKDIENLINTKPNEFFLQFADSLKKLSATDLAKTLDALKLNDNEVKLVLGAAGKNAEFFREKIELANQSLEDGTSLTKEFDIKNNNLAATLEKIQKTISGFFSSESFINWLTSSVQWFAKFIGATEDADGKITAWKNTLVNTAKIIAIVVAAMVSYNGSLKLVALYTNGLTSSTALMNLAQKANALTGGLLKTVFLGLQYVYYTLTIQTERATAAQIAFNNATKLNPIGLIIGLLVAAYTAYKLYNKEIDHSAIKQKNLNDIRNEAAKSVSDEKQRLTDLLKIAKDETQSKENRLNAIKRINEISPEYLNGITLETINTKEATKAINEYIKMLDRKAMKEAFESKRKEIARKLIDTRSNEDTSRYNPWYSSQNIDFKPIYKLEELTSDNELNKKNAEEFKRITKGWSGVVFDAYREYKQSIQNVKKELIDLNKESSKFIDSNADLYVASDSSVSTSDINLDGLKKEKKSPKEKKYDDSYLDEEKRRAEELIKLQEQNELERLNMLEDSYGKEIALEKTKHRSKIEELNRQNESYNMMLNDLDKQYLEAQKNGDVKKMESIKRSQLYITDLIQENNETIQISQETHLLKIATIQEKWAKDEISKAKEKYDLEKTQRETAFLEELNSLDLSAKEKQKRKEQFNKEEIAKEEEFLKSLITKLNDITKGTKNEAVDVNLLSPEQVEYFTQEAAKLGLTLQQLIDKKNELAGKGTDFSLLTGVGTDIFGFSPETWESTFSKLQTTEEKLKSLETVFGGLQNAWSSFSAFLDANDKRELKNIDKNTAAKKRKLKQDLDNGIINKVQYNKAIEKLDQDKEKKIAEIEYKKAKRDRIASLATIAIQTAIGISKSIAASPLTAGMPWTAIIAGIGALQAATVLATPLPAKGFEQGLYPEDVVREQDGRKFKAGYGGRTRSGMVRKPTYFLAGENYKPEMVIDNKAYRDLSPYTRNLLINELRGIKGFENGYYNPQSMRIEVPATPMPAVSNIPNDFLVSLIAENTEVMKELRDLKENGVIAYISKDLKEMKKLQEQLDKYKNLKRNNQV